MGFSYNVSVLNQKGSPAIYTDTFANRPTFGYAGRLFISSDTSAIYEDTGTSWVLIANVSSGAGTLQQVTTNGNTSNVGISITAGGLSTNSLTDTALTLGSVLFSGAGGLVSQDNPAFFWDDTNNRLGINTTTPSNTLDVHFAGASASIGINNTAGNPATIVFANTGTNKWRIGNTAGNTFDIINVGTVSSAISINSVSNVITLIANLIGTSANFAGNITASVTSGLSALTLNNASLSGRNWNFINTTNGADSDLSLFYSGTSGGTKVTFANNGNVGIGTTSPTNSTLEVRANADSISWGSVATLYGYLTWGTSASFGENVAIVKTPASTGIVFQPAGTEKMRITSGGNVLIGSTTDDTVNKLQVNGSTKIVGIGTFNKSSSGTAGAVGNLTQEIGTTVDGATKFSGFGFGYNGGSYYPSYISYYCTVGSGNTYGELRFAVRNTGSDVAATVALVIGSSGVITMSNLGGTGSRAVLADASGNLSAPVSDQSVKENIEPLKYGLETILKLNAIQFEFIEGYKNYGEGLQIGAIAQEVEQIIPEAVFTTPSTGLKGINYDQFNGIYIKAIQDQQKIIESLIKRIEALENK
jgi:hypothetical protein